MKLVVRCLEIKSSGTRWSFGPPIQCCWAMVCGKMWATTSRRSAKRAETIIGTLANNTTLQLGPTLQPCLLPGAVRSASANVAMSHSVTRKKGLPAAALSNDMLMLCTPRLIFKKGLTFMELICASPCFIAMWATGPRTKMRLYDENVQQHEVMPLHAPWPGKI